MPTLRIATFNVENLFSRAKILNFQNNENAVQPLSRVEELRAELHKDKYDKPKILELYHELKEFIEIVEVREKLFNRAKTKVIASGVARWGGFIEFRREKFDEAARENTARVLREVNADVCCLVEVESRPVLQHFCVDRLPKTGAFKDYKFQMLIDGNDQRGIDVALASRLPIRRMQSHIDDKIGKSRIFSRDCLEIEVVLPNQKSLWLLLNHFKSKGFGNQTENDKKRLRQATRVAEILSDKTKYDLAKDYVVVCGDLNDTAENPPLQPLLSLPHLTDVLQAAFPDEPEKRWTYHFQKNEQIDYLLVSDPLLAGLKQAGVERRGIHNVQKFTGGETQPFDTVLKPTDAASDHGAVWADFNI